MGADNYENLGFQVKIDGATDAVNHLDAIIDRLKQIQQLEGGKTSKSSSKALSEEEKYTQRVARSTQLLNSAKYEELRRTELANQQLKKEIDQRLKQELGINQTTKSLGAYLAKLTSVTVIARRLGTFISGAIQESANYVENLTLFQTAYGETYEETLDWALNLAKGFGLASNEVIKFAGTFRQLSTSLGLVGNIADTVSETVTKLGYDFSALFNVDIAETMEKLQSGIFTGQTRPLRAFGIDISQTQIDTLFETNETLASLGVNARNLSQAEKTLARLIITMESGSNAFGTMNREINNLQSQFRIFQASLSEFKLAIGQLVEEPLRNVMIYINGFIIAVTNIVKAFTPKKEEDNIFTSTALGAEEAEEAIDNLNGKLATFDKFNVLGGQSSGGNQLAVTEALNALLQEQAELYEKEIAKAMEQVQNEAVEMSKNIVGWFVKVDEEGNILYKDDMPIWTENAKVLGAAILSLATILTAKAVVSIVGFVASLFTLKNAIALVNTALIGGIVYSIIKAVEAFKAGDTATGLLAIAIGTVLVGAFIAIQLAQRKASLSQKEYTKALIAHTAALEKNTAALAKNAVQMNSSAESGKKLGTSFNNVGFAITAMVAAYLLADNIINSFDGEARKTASGVMVLVGAIMAVTAAIVAMNTSISWGTMLPVLLAGVGSAIAGVKGLMSDVENISTSAHANGGYSNANLIMTHENGKREWVGKAAGSSAIVNDTQMSDIMEVAVAKGVYQAMTASNSSNGGNGTTKNIYNFQVNGRTLLSVMEDEMHKQGKKLSKS